jgi:hypothetical protein
MIVHIDEIPQNISPIENYPLQLNGNNIVYASDILNKLKDEIPFIYTIYLIGGIVNRGFSNNDVDIWIKEKITKKEKIELTNYFMSILNFKIHIINVDLNEEKWNPIYLYKIYQNNKKVIY